MSLQFVLQFCIRVFFLLFIFRILHGFCQSFPGLPGIKPGATSYIDSSFLNVIILKKGNKWLKSLGVSWKEDFRK